MNHKQNLLLLHGAIGSKSHFNHLIEALEQDFNVHSMNFEGHGGRSSNNDFSISLFSENVLDWMEENAIAQINIFGYSMGGYVALFLARNHPSKVESIITLGTKFDWTPESALKESMMLNPEKIIEKVPKFAAALEKTHAPEDWKSVLNKTAKMMLELGNGSSMKEADFKQINIPVVIGRGTEDKMITKNESQHIASIIPNSKFVELNGVPHPIDQIDNEVLVHYISSFKSN